MCAPHVQNNIEAAIDVTSGHEDGAEGLSVATTVSEDNDEEMKALLETLVEIQIETLAGSLNW